MFSVLVAIDGLGVGRPVWFAMVGEELRLVGLSVGLGRGHQGETITPSLDTGFFFGGVVAGGGCVVVGLGLTVLGVVFFGAVGFAGGVVCVFDVEGVAESFASAEVFVSDGALLSDDAGRA